MNKKIFITGIAGFLGSHLADEFLRLGWKVSGCDNLIGVHRDNVPKEVEFYHQDCLDLEGIIRIKRGIDLLSHTAYEAFGIFYIFNRGKYSINFSVCDDCRH
jgi:UDP-glucose 4-epimerase